MQVSSANSASSVLAVFGMSLMNRLNRTGPRIDPCGTPASIILWVQKGIAYCYIQSPFFEIGAQ